MELPTREQFIESKAVLQGINQRYGTPKYKCPNCTDGGMCEDLYSCIVLTSMPPQYRSTYKCDKCGYEEQLTTF